MACGAGVLLWGVSSLGQAVDQHASQNSSPATASLAATSAPQLTVDEIVARLQKKNAERAAALEQYESTRVYGMTYRGFPSDRSAEMVVHMDYHAPSSKEFTIVSQSGLKYINDHVFRKLLEAEKDAAANAESRRRSALSAENYEFALAGYEGAADSGQYVLTLVPRFKNKYLYRGKIWIDAKDFAVVRIKGEPGVNPSFWIKRTDIEHTYQKIGEFWLPEQNRTESVIRLGGVAHLSIDYKDYKILKAEVVNPSSSK
jgi:hypothetical protein